MIIQNVRILDEDKKGIYAQVGAVKVRIDDTLDIIILDDGVIQITGDPDPEPWEKLVNNK